MAQSGNVPQTGLAKTVKKVSTGARISDAVLTVAFAIWAWYVGPEAGIGFWALIASSVFCAIAVFVSPIEILHRWVHGRMYSTKATRKS
jgi:hypothetical protein